MNTFEIISLIFVGVFAINTFLAAVVVFFERRNPSSTWAWLLLLFFVPILGFLIYFIFGRNKKRERGFNEKEYADREIYYDYIFKIKCCEDKKKLSKILTDPELEYLNDLVKLHQNSGHHISENNKIEILNNGRDKFASLFNDINLAKDFIFLEYYIIRNDNLGKEIISMLAQKAREGVSVCLIYDGMGCSRLPKDFFNELILAGGKVSEFYPRLLIRINYRDHRKLCVIDGKTGYVGGFNIGSEYLGLVKRYGPWRDTHIRIEGEAVDDLTLRFIMDWNYVSTEKMHIIKSYFPEKEKVGDVKTQIVSSGPDTKWENVRNGYFKMITEAEDHIYITTPYFVPDDGILSALKVAALSGIDVRIMIPANPDHVFVYWASMSYLGELIKMGARCYEYEEGFLHSKTIFIDSKAVSIGTANMDIRSFALNFEINAFIYDRLEAFKFEMDFLDDLNRAKEITVEEYEKRSFVFKFREAVSRLISPIL
ncbi:MAG: cardiolipin synthase [Lachnospiraceae bacterium]|nr:cardiolipin synthase [Lachnospiraceae bacterium]